MPQHVRKGDLVIVTHGDDAGKTGRVLKVLPHRGLVVVEGLNLQHKAVRQSQKYSQGGIITREGPMALCNVSPVVDGKPSRVRFRVEPDGSKVRVAVRGGEVLGQPLRKARK